MRTFTIDIDTLQVIGGQELNRRLRDAGFEFGYKETQFVLPFCTRATDVVLTPNGVHLVFTQEEKK
jgi:hypothetical protein